MIVINKWEFYFFFLGWKWISGAGRRLFNRSVWRDPSVAVSGRPLSDTHHQTLGGATQGAERRSTPVSRRASHVGLPQLRSLHQGFTPRGPAVGLPSLRARARLPRLEGSAQGDEGELDWRRGRRVWNEGGDGAGSIKGGGERVSAVPYAGFVRSVEARPRVGLLPGRCSSNTRLQSVRSRVFGTNGRVLE